MIDRTKPLTEQDPRDLRALLDALRGNRERYDRANRIVEARACELEIAEATRALAILNRRATDALDQQQDPPALTADEVRAVVYTIAAEEAEGFPIIAAAIADRVAEQLAGRVVALSAPTAPPELGFSGFVAEMDEVLREARETCAVDKRGRNVELYFGDMMRRLEDAVDVVNDRITSRGGRTLAEVAAQRSTADPAQRERVAELEATIETMKAEVFEAVEEARKCGAIAAEQGCLVANAPSDAVRTLANRYVEACEQREADLREAFLAGFEFAEDKAEVTEHDGWHKHDPRIEWQSSEQRDAAAAEYARSKAGG